ncbi:MAG: aminopeptidase [Bacteroidales bacterium]|nr:aminopeptidase [Bacteroidales bacterium]
MIKKVLPLLFLLAVSCTAVGPAVEEGVSRGLAEFRAERISGLRYDLAFRIPAEQAERVTGDGTISFSLSRRASVQLDFREGRDAVTSLKVNGSDCPADYRNEHIVLDRRLLRKGENRVEVSFISGDRSLNRNGDYLYTLFVPDRARTVFPCFDQPDLKGRFSLSLEIPASWEAVANGPEESVSVSAGRKTIRYLETPPLSTYLFSFAAGEWRKETRFRNGEPLSVYFRETDPAKVAQIDDIFSQVFQALDWLEAYTGIPNPFPKYDFVIVPGFQFGGMEHPGAILFNDKRMFLGAAPTTAEKLSRIELIAHETSHLWFGDAVTMRWFNDVWTKEVYANYFGAQISTPLFPEVNVPLRDFRNFNLPAYAEDRTAGTNAIRRDLPNLSSAGLIYGNIVYDKAPVVMRMLAGLLGEEAFRDGIREYLRKHMYGNADWNDLIAILDSRTDRDLRAWSRVWVEEKGMPEIRFTREGDTLAVRQEDPLGRGLAWPQQISFGDAAGKTVLSVWSDAPEVRVPVPEGCPEVLFPDLDALSYGWFVPDSATMRAAADVLPSIPRPEARLSLLATLQENALRGQLAPETLAGVLEKVLGSEKDPLVAGAAVSFLNTLAIHGPLAGSELIERLLYDTASDPSFPQEIRLTAFRTLVEVFRTEKVRAELWEVFRKGKDYKGLPLNVRDQMALSYELAVRMPGSYDEIRIMQEGRIENKDLLREFRFVYRAVSPDKESRDALFASLLDPENRAVEPWAGAVLGYLNHPLRQKDALSYIYPGLEELPEIQRTGDIFFPKNWCNALLRGHSGVAAKDEVLRFLGDHPDFPPLLECKLLQAADHLLRDTARDECPRFFRK